MSSRPNRGESVYRLPLNREDLLVGAFNPRQVRPTVYKSYESSSLGQIIIDNNKDLSTDRKLFNLVTRAPFQNNFDLIVDIDFEEFIEDTTDNTIQILEARINELLALLAGEQTNNAALQALIDSLRAQLAALQNEPRFDTSETINTVPDTLVLNGILYSDRTGEPGAPGAPSKQNMLLSKERKARLFIQDDGNVVITLGEYDKDGNALRQFDELVAAFGWSNGDIAPNFFGFFREGRTDGDKRDVVFTVGGLSPTYQPRYDGPRIRTSKISSTPRLVLSDDGLLSVYEGTQLLWTSYGFDYLTGGTTYNYTTTAGVTAAAQTGPAVTKYKTSMSNSGFPKITFTFKRFAGTNYAYNDSVTLRKLDTLKPLEVELITSPTTGQQSIKFKVPDNILSYLSTVSNISDKQDWSELIGQIIEADFKASDWTPLIPI